MKTTKGHNHYTGRRASARTATLLAALCLLLLASCERKPLYLRVEQAQVDVVIYDVQLDLLWGTDWMQQWQYDWDETAYGPLGYTRPGDVKASIYSLDAGAEGKPRKNCYVRVFPAKGGRVSLATGAWYDMLFYNAGTEYTLFDQAADYAYYHASTRRTDIAPSIPHTDGDTREDGEPAEYEGYKQPDELFGTFLNQLQVSEDPADYETFFDDETGQTTYLYHIKATLWPHTFIYLVQVLVVNNTDDKGDIVSVRRTRQSGQTIRAAAKDLTLTGVASGVSLFDRINFQSTAAITADEDHVRPLQHKMLRLPDGTQTEGDVFATRLLTWGLPTIDPLAEWDRVKAGTSNTHYGEPNKLAVRFYLRNGKLYNVLYDVSEQMRRRPAGGVITVVLDASKIDPGELDPIDPNGGGFDAEVGGWNEINADITI